MFFGCCGCQGGNWYWLRKYTKTPGVFVVAEADHPDPDSGTIPLTLIENSSNLIVWTTRYVGTYPNGRYKYRWTRYTYNTSLDLVAQASVDVQSIVYNTEGESEVFSTNGSWIAFVTEQTLYSPTSPPDATIDVYDDTLTFRYQLSFLPTLDGGTMLQDFGFDSSNNLYVTTSARGFPGFIPATVKVWKYNTSGTQQWTSTQSSSAISGFDRGTLRIASDDHVWIGRTSRIERWSPAGTPAFIGTSSPTFAMYPDGSSGMWCLSGGSLSSAVTVRRLTSGALADAFTPFLIQANVLTCVFPEGQSALWGTGPYVTYHGGGAIPQYPAAPLVKWNTTGNVAQRWESAPTATRPLFWHNGQAFTPGQYGIRHRFGVLSGSDVYVTGYRTRSYP
jgi:hypothetical protein